MNRTLIDHVRIVNDGTTREGSVVIEGERIAEVLAPGETPAQPCDTTIDGNGACLLPGVIDDHVHFRDPGLTQKADMESESRAAAAGGVTSFMDMPNTVPQTTTLEALEAKFADAARQSRVNYSFYFGATNTNAPLLHELDKNRVCGVKLFMGSSTGNMLVDRMDVLRTIFAESGLPIVAHCEDQTIIAENTRHYKDLYGDDPDVKFHPLIRSAEACYRSSALAVRLAHETGARLHIAHISTARELELLEAAPLEQKRITAEACIAHLYFTENDYATLGTRIKCNPSIKTESDRAAVRAALKNGIIGTAGSDHAPHLRSEKDRKYLSAPSGIPSVGQSLQVLLTVAFESDIPLTKIAAAFSEKASEIFGIRDRGKIREGYFADLAVVDTDVFQTIDEVAYKCGWSPYQGRTLRGRITDVFINGRHVVENSVLADTTPHGEKIIF